MRRVKADYAREVVLEPKAEYVIVTPDVAREWLAIEEVLVRRHSNAAVHRIFRDIDHDQWYPGWDGIAFLANGQRVNGRHRLLGVIEAEKEAPFLVCRGLPAATVEVGDQIRKRTMAQVLAAQDEYDPTALAGALRLYAQWRKGHQIASRSSEAAPSVREMLDLLKENPGLRESVRVARSINKGAQMGSRALAAMLHYVFTNADPDEAETFFDRLEDGTDLRDSDPILKLRQRLLELRGRSGVSSKGVDARYKAALTIIAFNMWRRGEEVTRLSWRGGGSRPSPFPEIEPAAESLVQAENT